MKERKLNRYPNFDYSNPGSYYVTICVHERKNVFGVIQNGMMILNNCGRIIQETWLDLPNHYQNILLDEFIIMPNHFHGIIHKLEEGIRISSPVGNGLKPFPTKEILNHNLSEIIRGFKTFSSRRINELIKPEKFKWQKSFYDRIIRREEELYQIRNYIMNNPSNWHIDEENTKAA